MVRQHPAHGSHGPGEAVGRGPPTAQPTQNGVRLRIRNTHRWSLKSDTWAPACHRPSLAGRPVPLLPARHGRGRGRGKDPAGTSTHGAWRTPRVQPQVRPTSPGTISNNPSGRVAPSWYLTGARQPQEAPWRPQAALTPGAHLPPAHPAWAPERGPRSGRWRRRQRVHRAMNVSEPWARPPALPAGTAGASAGDSEPPTPDIWWRPLPV